MPSIIMLCFFASRPRRRREPPPKSNALIVHEEGYDGVEQSAREVEAASKDCALAPCMLLLAPAATPSAALTVLDLGGQSFEPSVADVERVTLALSRSRTVQFFGYGGLKCVHRSQRARLKMLCVALPGVRADACGCLVAT